MDWVAKPSRKGWKYENVIKYKNIKNSVGRNKRIKQNTQTHVEAVCAPKNMSPLGWATNESARERERESKEERVNNIAVNQQHENCTVINILRSTAPLSAPTLCAHQLLHLSPPVHRWALGRVAYKIASEESLSFHCLSGHLATSTFAEYRWYITITTTTITTRKRRTTKNCSNTNDVENENG
ncbi:unnamed protein product [Ceratitis capitata]|uniref:(Mediterranean fruit fly) hypothetical protein n=1 Tax=Ceratitis capitata TaxID=7213 RepID=A0A811VG27_CERCA|nr:unnamed protein product [Ceratitis capitata]